MACSDAKRVISDILIETDCYSECWDFISEKYSEACILLCIGNEILEAGYRLKIKEEE